MSTQDIYLTPNQILLYLKDFEEKLPCPPKDRFVSTLRIKPLTIDALNNEVNSMAKFIGMNGFSADCRWAKLPNGIGGQIKLNGSRCGLLEIEVNESYKYDLEVTSATLAHELCHKYLQINGIYFPNFTEINETYTDLCTMYVGFDNIVIKGYLTDKWKSGYLKYPIYKRTLYLVRAIIWGEVVAVVEDYGEPYLTETLRVWVTSKNKQYLSRKEYKDTYREFADYHRNLEVFKQLLDMLEEQFLKLTESVDDKMYQPDWFDSDGNITQKVACFIGVYQGMIIKERFRDTSIHKVNRHLMHLNAQLVDAIGRNRFPTNRVNRLYFECPYCKQRALSPKIANSNTIVRCPNCRKRFAVNGEEFDLILARNDFDKFKDELMIPIRQAFDASLKREKEKEHQLSYNAGYADGKVAKARELAVLQTKISNLPRWIKWIIGNRLGNDKKISSSKH